MHTPQKALNDTLHLQEESLTLKDKTKPRQKNPYPCCQLNETEESRIQSDTDPTLALGNGHDNLTHYPLQISMIMSCIYYIPPHRINILFVYFPSPSSVIKPLCIVSIHLRTCLSFNRSIPQLVNDKARTGSGFLDSCTAMTCSKTTSCLPTSLNCWPSVWGHPCSGTHLSSRLCFNLGSSHIPYRPCLALCPA